METHKVNVNKSDEATLIAERIIDLKVKEIILSVPRFAKLAESGANFRLLKREAEALGKKIIIESVDDKVLELAKASGLECLNPFFSDAKPEFRDIVHGKPKKEMPLAARANQHQIIEEHKPKGHHEEHIREPGDVEKTIERPVTLARSRGFRLARLAKFSVLTLIALVIGGGLFLAIHVMPRADIKIVTARTNWVFKDAVTADKTVTQVDAAAVKIPGQIFKEKKNLTLSFPASSRRRLTEKAAGKIIIYNAHSAAPQPLVATTRFEAPDGKILRLVDRVVVPGAKIIQGRIERSSTHARVVADVAGEAYNIGPISKFTIPGFKGTPRFATFYAESREAMRGGRIGESAYPSADDISKAKETAGKTLENSMRTLILAQVPEGFKLVEGATQYKLLKQEVDTRVDETNKFSVFAEAELTMMLFKEQHILDMLSGRIEADAGPDFEVKNYELAYTNPEFNAAGGKLTLRLDYEGVLAKKVDIGFLKNKIAGKSESDFKALIFSIPGLKSAQASLWPIWVRNIPKDTDKINITVD